MDGSLVASAVFKTVAPPSLWWRVSSILTRSRYFSAIYISVTSIPPPYNLVIARMVCEPVQIRNLYNFPGSKQFLRVAPAGKP